MNLTTEQLRALPLNAPPEQRDEHAQALQRIVNRGEEQVTASQALDALVCQALDDVTSVPLPQMNVERLRQVQGHVQAQVEALRTIITAAQAQAQTLEQVGALDRVSAEHQQRVEQLHSLAAENEVLALGEAGEEIVTRIAQLTEAHDSQLNALEQIGHSVIEQLPETGVSREEQRDTLEQLAQAAQEKAATLQPDA